jgi:transcriptional regulator, ArsR family
MADIFDVIADGTRREILRLLLDRSADGERGTSVSQIVHELGVSQPTVSKHLKVLRESHLVSVREEGQHRYYSLSAGPLDEVDDWLMPFLEDESDYSFRRDHGASRLGGACRRGRRARRGIREARRRERPQAPPRPLSRRSVIPVPAAERADRLAGSGR